MFAIANHFNSKGGDEPLFGRFQPPVRVSEVAAAHSRRPSVDAFVEAGPGRRPDARDVVVLGDINDFEFSETLEILRGRAGLLEPDGDAAGDERYSYVFEGNSQVLDQILVSTALLAPCRITTSCT